MANVCMYFQVHQPYRLKRYSVFEIGEHKNYFDQEKNRAVLNKVAQKCYLPANAVLLDLIKKHKGRFKVAFSLSGVALEQFEEYAPEVIASFKALADTGCVEFLAETYYHSLSFLFSKEDFVAQVDKHTKKIESLFGVTPDVFRNTELIYNNELAAFIEGLGYKAILAEGADHILGWRSSNYVYKPHTTKNIKLLLKNYKLSDDVAFRFSQQSWKDFPLSAPKYASWVHESPGESVNLFMDYETFGEHQWEDTGIFNFLAHLPTELFNRDLKFYLPSELAEQPAKDTLDIHNFVSWADMERDLSAWRGNQMQENALYELYQLESAIKKTGDSELLDLWRRLQTSDHFYYMCTKYFNDGDVHKYFNPYESPYEAFVAFMNVLNDLVIRINKRTAQQTARRKPQRPTLESMQVSGAPSQNMISN